VGADVSALAVTVGRASAPPQLFSRVLATYVAANLRDARGFLDRNADTWRHALEPGEGGFVAWCHDRDGVAVLFRAYARDRDIPHNEYGRAEIRRMRNDARKTTKTTTNNGTRRARR
jgi:hypothetical protein